MTALPVTYGLVRRDGLHLALPLTVLREVVPRPERFERLPHDLAGLVGAHVLRGTIVPVVELSPPSGVAADREHEEIVAILQHGSRVLGVLADAAEGIVTVEDGDVTLMDSGRGSVFTRPEVDGVVSVIDVGSLFDRYEQVAVVVDDAVVPEGEPVSSDAATQPAGDGAVASSAGSALPMLMIRCDDIGLGIPISTIEGMQTTAQIDTSPLQGGACLGTITYRDAVVPIVDPLRLLGLGQTGGADRQQFLIMQLAGGMVALLVSTVVQLAHVVESEVQAVPSFGLRRPRDLRGLWDGGDLGRFLLLTDDVLSSDDELRALSRMNLDEGRPTAGERTDEDGEGADQSLLRDVRTYLTYDCGVETATPLHEVEAIIDLPSAVLGYETTAPWVLGLFDHRGTMVPLVHLPTMVGRHDAGSAVVLVVRGQTGTVGFALDRLLSIETSTQLIVEGQVPTAPSGAVVPLDDRPFALLDGDRMVPVLDLQAVCDELCAGSLTT